MDADLIYAEKMDMGDNRKGRGDGHLKKIGIFTLLSNSSLEKNI